MLGFEGKEINLFYFSWNPFQGGLDSPAVVTAPMVKEKLKIREKLRKFFLRRPNVEDLMKRGIMKNEPVFGSTLLLLARWGIHCNHVSAVLTVPLFTLDSLH